MIPQLPLLSLPIAPAVQCRICGANLLGVLHRDTPSGPECLVCPPVSLRRSWQPGIDFEPPRMAEAQGLEVHHHRALADIRRCAEIERAAQAEAQAGANP